MITTAQKKLPFVVFKIKEAHYALSAESVREIIVMPPVTAIPKARPEVRGVINLRGKILTLIDLRIKLGLQPLQTEINALVQLLTDREQDHRNWLQELEGCVRENRPFGLARDPHKCKFGLWYDQFSTTDRLLRMTLPSMDGPHKAIHATADAALARAEKGDREGALELIAERRGQELSALIKLFAESRRILTEGHREIAVVLSRGKDWLAFSADLVEAAELIPEDRIEPMPVALPNHEQEQGIAARVGKRLKTDETVLILEEEFFFGAS